MSDAAGKYDVRAYSKISNGEIYYFCEECAIEIDFNRFDAKFSLIEEYEDEDTFEFVKDYICEECLCEQSEKR